MTARAGALLRRALLTVLATLTVAGLVPPANAADGHLEVSLGGVSWSSSLPDALFADDILLVPGQSVTTELHLRSTAPTAGVLELALMNISASDEWAAQSFGFQVELAEGRGDDTPGGDLPRTRFADLEEGTRLGTPVHLEPGEAVALTLTIDLDARATGNHSQNSAIGLDLMISFVDALASGIGETDEDARADHGREAALERVIPVFGSENSAAHPEPHSSTEHTGERSTSNDPGAQNRDRGVLAVTGSPAMGMFIGSLAVLLLGAVLLLISRRRTQEKR